MSTRTKVMGYKVFNPDWTCTPNGKSKQYTCPGFFEEEVSLAICNTGMHFCRNAADCFTYYSFDPNNKVAEVIAYGTIVERDDKCCTDKLEIVREIPWVELLDIVNTGKGCTGLRNTGNWNTGNWNTGNRNTGDWNTGDWNTGNRNTGDWNTGNWNTGNRNTGDWNTGDWNATNHSSGCFCTKEPTINLFDKLSDMTYSDWLGSTAYYILSQMPSITTTYITFSVMTEDEKVAYPDAELTGGYLKQIDIAKSRVAWWRGLTDDQKAIVTAIPNFDAAIFKQITGIDVNVK